LSKNSYDHPCLFCMLYFMCGC